MEPDVTVPDAEVEVAAVPEMNEPEITDTSGGEVASGQGTEPVEDTAEEPVEMSMAEAASSGDPGGETGGESGGDSSEGSTNPDVAVVTPEQGGSEPPACAPGYIWVEPGPG